MRRTNAFYPMTQLRGEVDRLLGDFFGTPAVPAGVYPPMNVWEENETLFAEAELPGFRNEDVDISVVGNELTIKGARPEANWDEGKPTFHRRERGVGTFTRVLRLPVEINAEKIEAELRDGVLTIRLPKAEAAKPRKIAIGGNT